MQGMAVLCKRVGCKCEVKQIILFPPDERLLQLAYIAHSIPQPEQPEQEADEEEHFDQVSLFLGDCHTH